MDVVNYLASTFERGPNLDLSVYTDSNKYFVKHKSDAPKALDQYLTDTRDIGPPEIIRYDYTIHYRGRG